MKKAFVLTVMTAMACTVVLAGPPTKVTVFNNDKLELIEENLAIGLTTNCPGMQASAALTMRQVKDLAPQYEFDDLVIPLMRIVKEENCTDVSRIAAALALHDLKSERGDFAIAMTARFTSCQRVKKICELLTADRAVEKEQK